MYLYDIFAKHSSYQNMRRDFEMTPNIKNKSSWKYCKILLTDKRDRGTDSWKTGLSRCV